MTKVRIKTKGQFFGQTGTVTKILNQHQIMVAFPNIQGNFLFSHRNVELIEVDRLPILDVKVAQIERNAQNKVLEDLINEIATESKELQSYGTEAAKWYVKGLTCAMQLASGKLNIKLD